MVRGCFALALSWRASGIQGIPSGQLAHVWSFCRDVEVLLPTKLYAEDASTSTGPPLELATSQLFLLQLRVHCRIQRGIVIHLQLPINLEAPLAGDYLLPEAIQASG